MATKVAKGAPVIPADIEKQLLSVEMLPVTDLIVDSSYQRDLNLDEVTKMVREWNWLACRPLAVSLRTRGRKSEYAVIDGQQRLESIKRLGFAEAPCQIYVDLTPLQEAELYELLNRSKKPTFNDLFKSRLHRREEVASNIELGAKQIGYILDPERRHGHSSKDAHFYIQTMVELERIYKHGGIVHLMDTLKLYRDVFAPEYVEKQASMISGLGTFLSRYPSVNRDELINKLKREGQNKIVQRAFQWRSMFGVVGGIGEAYAEAMLIIYNTNRQEANRVKSIRM